VTWLACIFCTKEFVSGSCFWVWNGIGDSYRGNRSGFGFVGAKVGVWKRFREGKHWCQRWWEEDEVL
jgi:hypothetical protein